MDREKTTLSTSLQECEAQLQHAQTALFEQHARARRLRECLGSRRRQRSTSDKKALEDEEEEEDDEKGLFSQTEGPSVEVMQCKYRVAVTEVVGLKAELKDCPRDSGCYIPSDVSDNSKDDTDNLLALSSSPAEA